MHIFVFRCTALKQNITLPFGVSLAAESFMLMQVKSVYVLRSCPKHAHKRKKCGNLWASACMKFEILVYVYISVN